MINLILFGPPGSGKGTQAAKLVEKYELNHISTGDLFRYEIGNKTPLGIKAQEYMNKGELVPDEVTMGMLKNKVNTFENPKGFIFDGVPRNIAQSGILDAFLAEKNAEVSLLVAIDVPEEDIVQRIKLRGEHSGRPDDKDENIIRNRFQVYLKETAAVAEFYEAKGKSTAVHGLGTVDEVFDRLCAKIDTVV